jgi:hypothetical protein
MKIQVLTFQVNHSMPSAEVARWSEIVELAIGEFDGVVSGRCLTGTTPGMFGGLIVWESDEAMDRFRHSELYARLMLSPALDDAVDEDYPVRGFTPRLAPVLAAA